MPFLLNYKRADRVPTVLVQEALLAQGFTPGPADGRFGLSTLRAVVAYQRQHGLDETGAVDEGLYRSITTGKAPPAKKPVAKKAVAKKATAKKPAAKKSPTKKPAAKKAKA
tara:strand:- start:500 stop:832 length:333 start_codon:yes stop_codon:yes gene_type:complete